MFPSQASHGFCLSRPPCPLPLIFEYFYTQFKTPEAVKLPMTEYILKVFHVHVPVSHNLLAMFLQDIQAKYILPSPPQAPNFPYFTQSKCQAAGLIETSKCKMPISCKWANLDAPLQFSR